MTTAGIEIGDEILAGAIAASAAGKRNQALELFLRYAAAHPKDPIATFNVAKALRDAGKLDEAALRYREAAELDPRDPDIWYNLGNVLRETGDLTGARDAFVRVIDLNPAYANAHNNLGLVAAALGKNEEARTAYENAIHADPRLREARSNLSALLLRNGSSHEARRIAHEVVSEDPLSAVAHYNLGGVHREEGNLSAAMKEYDAALALNPGYAEALHNRGICRLWSGDPTAALMDFEASLLLMPDFADAHYNRAFALLLLGDFANGWMEYEWRFRTSDGANPEPRYACPRLRDPDVSGKRVCVCTEQGFGDAIQFSRFLTIVANSGATVVVHCQKELVELFRSIKGVTAVASLDEPPPEAEFYIPMMSLPGLIGIMAETIPTTIPYLAPSREALEKFGALMPRVAGQLMVGFAGESATSNKYLQSRNCPPDISSVLNEAKGVTFVNLEKEISESNHPRHAPWAKPVGATFSSFNETAAAIEQLDLVITIDTATAHLAGALGKPVWLMLPFAADWRWLTSRITSPWYPSMRVFRQRAAGEWSDLIARVKTALEAFVDAQVVSRDRPVSGHRIALSDESLLRFRDFIDWVGGMTYPETPMQMHTAITAAMVPKVIERCGLHEGCAILDVGCGQGPALDLFHSKGFAPIGIGINDEDLLVCRSKGHTVFEMDQSFLDFSDDQFDLIWARHCVEHSFAPLLTLRGFHRVMKPGGWLYLEVPAPETPCHHESNPNHYSVLHSSLWQHLVLKSGLTIESHTSIDLPINGGMDRYLVFLARKP